MAETKSPSGKLIVDKEGPITRITLNRPEVHNALDRELSQELNDAVKEVNVDRDCRIMLLTGAGDTFCAGDDIKEFNDWKPSDAQWQIRLYQETVTIIDNLIPVTIAAVDGVCTGGSDPPETACVASSQCSGGGVCAFPGGLDIIPLEGCEMLVYVEDEVPGREFALHAERVLESRFDYTPVAALSDQKPRPRCEEWLEHEEALVDRAKLVHPEFGETGTAPERSPCASRGAERD